jgi:hypothetical protein
MLWSRSTGVPLAVAATILLALAGLAVWSWQTIQLELNPTHLQGESEPTGPAQERDDFDHRFQVLARGMDTREGIVREVIAGRMSLFIAAAWFRAIDDELRPPKFPYELRYAYPGDSYEERQCRRVIKDVYDALEDDPCWRAARAAHLERELDEHLRRNGMVRLPEVKGDPLQQGAPGKARRASAVECPTATGIQASQAEGPDGGGSSPGGARGRQRQPRPRSRTARPRTSRPEVRVG